MTKTSDRINKLYIILPVILFCFLALSIGADLFSSFDAKFYDEVAEEMNPILTLVMLRITHFGDIGSVILITGLLFVFKSTRKRLAVPIGSAVICSTTLNILLKQVFARERPDILRLINETTYSFPSGHAMVNATLYIMLAYFIYRKVRSCWLKWLLIACCGLVVGLISLSRIYLGVHYFTDIVGGLLFGFAIAILFINLYYRDINDRRA